MGLKRFLGILAYLRINMCGYKIVVRESIVCKWNAHRFLESNLAFYTLVSQIPPQLTSKSSWGLSTGSIGYRTGGNGWDFARTCLKALGITTYHPHSFHGWRNWREFPEGSGDPSHNRKLISWELCTRWTPRMAWGWRFAQLLFLKTLFNQAVGVGRENMRQIFKLFDPVLTGNLTPTAQKANN